MNTPGGPSGAASECTLLADPVLLYTELDKELEEQASEGLQMAPDSDLTPGGGDQPFHETPVPYVEVVGKMMDAFEDFGLWNMIGGKELAPLPCTGRDEGKGTTGS